MRKALVTEFSSEELETLILAAVKKAFLETTIPPINAPPMEPAQMLSSKEACALLKISAPTLIKLRSGGKIKARKIGGKLFYSKNEILKLLK